MSDPALAQHLPGQRAALRSRWLAYALAIAVIIVLPLIFNDTYWRTNLTVCAINVLLAIGLDFILGYAGQLNLGHSAFYGLGAYVSTLTLITGLPEVLISVVKATVFGLIAGLVGCYRGLTVSGGAKGVGTAVNETLVLCVIALFAVNVVLTTIGVKFGTQAG